MDQPESEKTVAGAATGKRWRWLGVEFLVIGLGVFAALAVDTWVEERENDRRAAEYRERLKTDLQRDVANLNDVIDYYHGIREFGLVTLADLSGDQRLDDFTLMFAAFNAAEEWGFSLESSTYNDMQSTGGLALIDDVELRIDLADYHRQGRSRAEVWDLPRGYREAARGIIPNSLQAAIHESCVPNFDTDEPLSAASSAGARLPATGEPLTGSAKSQGNCGLSPAEFDTARAAGELRADSQVARLLRFRNSEVRVAIALFEGQRILAEGLLERLKTDH